MSRARHLLWARETVHWLINRDSGNRVATVLLALLLAGQFIVGAVVSLTVKVVVQLLLLPDPSVAVTVIV